MQLVGMRRSRSASALWARTKSGLQAIEGALSEGVHHQATANNSLIAMQHPVQVWMIIGVAGLLHTRRKLKPGFTPPQLRLARWAMTIVRECSECQYAPQNVSSIVWAFNISAFELQRGIIAHNVLWRHSTQ
jgi:hypothetical protein